ncbi:MAG TPA: glycosyltransferase [Candidatus Poseidoniales archaeon]|nr:glycosyltransferase [Candidatus Poseidoniales archaeon]
MSSLRNLVSDLRPKLLVVKAAMDVNGGAARDLLRNLPEISKHFHVKFACLNILDSQKSFLQKQGITVFVPEEQWIAKGGLFNEITAGQERSSAKAWRDSPSIDDAIGWADIIHLTGGNGSMEFTQLVPKTKPMHLHFLESKPGLHDDISHLKPDGGGRWKPPLMHLLQIYQRKKVEDSFSLFKNNSRWEISANSKFSAANLLRIYQIRGDIIYPSVDLSEFSRNYSDSEILAFNELNLPPSGSYLVTVGRISRFKGIYEAVEHIRNSGLALVVIGGGNSRENESLISFGKKIGVNINVLSDLDSEAMRAVLRNSVAVIGLAHGEAFGLTPIEAMAIGIPPIFVNEGGYRETIIDGENGRLISRHDLSEWKEAFEQAQDIEIRSRWSNSGLQRIAKLGLSPENHAVKLQSKLNSMLSMEESP